VQPCSEFGLSLQRHVPDGGVQCRPVYRATEPRVPLRRCIAKLIVVTVCTRMCIHDRRRLCSWVCPTCAASQQLVHA
jgi:hypothetical protein